MSQSLVSPKELAAILGVKYVTVLNLTKDKKIPFLMVGTLYRYNVQEVMESLKTYPQHQRHEEVTHTKNLVA